MQADALAYGKTPEQLRSENVPDYLIPHRTFSGNRPSMSIMLPSCNAYTVGQLLALYEHRVAVQVRWRVTGRCRVTWRRWIVIGEEDSYGDDNIHGWGAYGHFDERQQEKGHAQAGKMNRCV